MNRIEFNSLMLLLSRQVTMLMRAQHRAKFNLAFLDVDVDVITVVHNDRAHDVIFYFNDEKVGGRSAARVCYAKLCADTLYNAMTDSFGAQLDNIFGWSSCRACNGVIPDGWLCPHCGLDPTDPVEEVIQCTCIV